MIRRHHQLHPIDSPYIAPHHLSLFSRLALSVDWAIRDYAPVSAEVGDVVTFTYSASHDVWQFNDEAAFEACDFSSATMLADKRDSPFDVTVTSPSMFIGCSVGSHCRSGQKVVLGAAGAAWAVKSAVKDRCCEDCAVEGEVKYHSVDMRFMHCGECCMRPDQYALFKIFEKNLTLSENNTPCKELGWPVYESTVSHGIWPVKMTLDLFDEK